MCMWRSHVYFDSEVYNRYIYIYMILSGQNVPKPSKNNSGNDEIMRKQPRNIKKTNVIMKKELTQLGKYL